MTKSEPPGNPRQLGFGMQYSSVYNSIFIRAPQLLATTMISGDFSSMQPVLSPNMLVVRIPKKLHFVGCFVERLFFFFYPTLLTVHVTMEVASSNFVLWFIFDQWVSSVTLLDCAAVLASPAKSPVNRCVFFFRLILGMMITSSSLSMWLSNSATTAMMLPIANAILESLFGDLESLKERCKITDDPEGMQESK